MKHEKNPTTQALARRRTALVERRTAAGHATLGDVLGASHLLTEADRQDAMADALLEVTTRPGVSHGEVLPDNLDPRAAIIRDTLEQPDATAIDASIARTDLLLKDNIDVAALALDAAASIEARNSLEKMLAHQLALVHKSSFEMMSAAAACLESKGGPFAPKPDTVEATRLTNAAARLMSTFQQGLLTLQRLRTGGSQTVTVQHVHVSDGGQAVIGNVQAGGGGSRGGDDE